MSREPARLGRPTRANELDDGGAKLVGQARPRVYDEVPIGPFSCLLVPNFSTTGSTTNSLARSNVRWNLRTYKTALGSSIPPASTTQARAGEGAAADGHLAPIEAAGFKPTGAAAKSQLASLERSALQ